MRAACVLLVALTGFVPGCADDRVEPPDPGEGDRNGSTGGKGDDPTACADGGCAFDVGTFDLGELGPEVSGDAGRVDPNDVPADPEALFAYLEAGVYLELRGQSSIQRTGGFHDATRTFFNDTLFESVQSDAAAHPVGAAAVKELFDANDEHVGWAVVIREPDDWWWYENQSLTENDPSTVGTGGLCARCHAGAPDMIITELPFD